MTRGENPQPAHQFAPDAALVLYHGDVAAFAATLPDRCMHLVITSPPYNLGKAYETPQHIEHYLAQQETVIGELCRVLHDEGSLCWQVGNFVAHGEVFPLDIYSYPLFKRHGLHLRNRIIWHFGHGLHAARRFSGRYETLLWFTRSARYRFNLDAVRVPSKYPGKRHYKGPRRGQPAGNTRGKNTSDLWEIVAQDWESEQWDIPNVKANHPEKTSHPCQFPVELAQRCVLALTDEGDTVFDPYAGSGSALIAAAMHGRRAVGCEKEAAYIDLARERLRALADGTLRVRPLGKPVHVPSGRENVCQVPDEWKKKREIA